MDVIAGKCLSREEFPTLMDAFRRRAGLKIEASAEAQKEETLLEKAVARAQEDGIMTVSEAKVLLEGELEKPEH